MNKEVLMVDDDVNILSSFKRSMRNYFSVFTANGGEEALKIIDEKGTPFAVVVSDMRMPGMNGIDLLSKVRERSRDTVRIMLTGYADVETAVNAVNEGNIFRFLRKPCSMEILRTTIKSGIDQYKLNTAEKELLGKTLTGSIKMLSEVLALVNPPAFSRAARTHKYVSYICDKMRLKNGWQIEMSAMLSQIGCVTLTAEILDKMLHGKSLTNTEKEMVRKYPEKGAELLDKIPRMKTVSEIIKRQNIPFRRLLEEKSNHKTGREDTADIFTGAQILKFTLDLDKMVIEGMTQKQAIRSMLEQDDVYDPEIVKTFSGYESQYESDDFRKVSLKELFCGMILNENIISSDGTILAAQGMEVTESIKIRLENFKERIGIKEPFMVIEKANDAGRDGERTERSDER